MREIFSLDEAEMRAVDLLPSLMFDGLAWQDWEYQNLLD
jgi:hypothetical protein